MSSNIESLHDLFDRFAEFAQSSSTRGTTTTTTATTTNDDRWIPDPGDINSHGGRFVNEDRDFWTVSSNDDDNDDDDDDEEDEEEEEEEEIETNVLEENESAVVVLDEEEEQERENADLNADEEESSVVEDAESEEEEDENYEADRLAVAARQADINLCGVLDRTTVSLNNASFSPLRQIHDRFVMDDRMDVSVVDDDNDDLAAEAAAADADAEGLRTFSVGDRDFAIELPNVTDVLVVDDTMTTTNTNSNNNSGRNSGNINGNMNGNMNDDLESDSDSIQSFSSSSSSSSVSIVSSSNNRSYREEHGYRREHRRRRQRMSRRRERGRRVDARDEERREYREENVFRRSSYGTTGGASTDERRQRRPRQGRSQRRRRDGNNNSNENRRSGARGVVGNDDTFYRVSGYVRVNVCSPVLGSSSSSNNTTAATATTTINNDNDRSRLTIDIRDSRRVMTGNERTYRDTMRYVRYLNRRLREGVETEARRYPDLRDSKYRNVRELLVDGRSTAPALRSTVKRLYALNELWRSCRERKLSVIRDANETADALLSKMRMFERQIRSAEVYACRERNIAVEMNRLYERGQRRLERVERRRAREADRTLRRFARIRERFARIRERMVASTVLVIDSEDNEDNDNNNDDNDVVVTTVTAAAATAVAASTTATVTEAAAVTVVAPENPSDIADRSLREFAETIDQCCICLCDKPLHAFAFSLSCTHRTCFECLVSHMLAPFTDTFNVVFPSNGNFVDQIIRDMFTRPCAICRTPLSEVMLLVCRNDVYNYELLTDQRLRDEIRELLPLTLRLVRG